MKIIKKKTLNRKTMTSSNLTHDKEFKKGLKHNFLFIYLKLTRELVYEKDQSRGSQPERISLSLSSFAK